MRLGDSEKLTGDAPRLLNHLLALGFARVMKSRDRQKLYKRSMSNASLACKNDILHTKAKFQFLLFGMLHGILKFLGYPIASNR